MVTATIPVGSESDAVAANPLTGSVYVASQLANTVSVISGQTNTVTATIPVANPQGMAVNPLDRRCLRHQLQQRHRVGDQRPDQHGHRHHPESASLPISVAVNPLTGDVYVANFNDRTVSVISGRTSTVTATIPVGTSPYGVAVSLLTGDVYVTNFSDGTVSVISGRTSTVTATILSRRQPGRGRGEPADRRCLRRQLRQQHRVGDQRPDQHGHRHHPGR